MVFVVFCTVMVYVVFCIAIVYVVLCIVMVYVVLCSVIDICYFALSWFMFFCIIIIYVVFCTVSTTTTFIFFSHLEGADKSAEKEDDTTREFRTSFGY
jgi:hypothetical protein